VAVTSYHDCYERKISKPNCNDALSAGSPTAPAPAGPCPSPIRLHPERRCARPERTRPDLRQSGPDRARPKGAHDQLVYGRIAALRSEGTSYGSIAELINTEFPSGSSLVSRRPARHRVSVARRPAS
jgi:hypothetical protein